MLKRGDWDGLDDPRDVPWRLKGEELVREAVASVPGIKCYDITWNQAELQVALNHRKRSTLPSPLTAHPVVQFDLCPKNQRFVHHLSNFLCLLLSSPGMSS